MILLMYFFFDKNSRCGIVLPKITSRTCRQPTHVHVSVLVARTHLLRSRVARTRLVRSRVVRTRLHRAPLARTRLYHVPLARFRLSWSPLARTCLGCTNRVRMPSSSGPPSLGCATLALTHILEFIIVPAPAVENKEN